MKILQESKDYIIQNYLSRGNIIELAKEFGTTDTMIYRLLKNNNISKRNINNRKYFINENFFEKIDNEQKAYWLGFLLADGCVSQRNDKCMLLQLSLANKDIDHINKFQKDLQSSYPLRYKKKVNMTYVHYCNTKICQDLIKLGCLPKKTFLVEFPKIDSSLYFDLIRGYFDGDGCIHISKALTKSGKPKRHCWSICGTRKFLEKVHLILLENDIDSNIYKKGNISYLVVVKINQLPKLYNILYNNCTIKMDRKYNKFKDYLKKDYNYDSIL